MMNDTQAYTMATLKTKSESVSSSFPLRLHKLLAAAEQDDFRDIVSWQEGDQSFKVHKPEEFANHIMPFYFNQTKYKSFQRQLNLYGFMRIPSGRTKGSYGHKFFIRSNPALSQLMHRHKHPVSIALHHKRRITLSEINDNCDFPSTSSRLHNCEDDAGNSDVIPTCDFDSVLGEGLPPFQDITFHPSKNDVEDLDVDILSALFDLDDEFGLASHDSTILIKGEAPYEEFSSTCGKPLMGMRPKNDGICEKTKPHSEHAFPWKLHDMLSAAQSEHFHDVVSWEPNGLSFKVHRIEDFVQQILPLYFDQTKFESFRRQLNLYGFTRITRGPNRGMYVHRCFLKSDRSLCQHVTRQNI